MEHKTETIPPEILRTQAALYREGLFEAYRHLYNEPVLVVKRPGRAQKPIFRLSELVRPETIEKMGPEAPGCGCVK